MIDKILEYNPNLDIKQKKCAYIDNDGNEINEEVIDTSFPCSVNIVALNVNRPCECIKIANEIISNCKEKLNYIREQLKKEYGRDFLFENEKEMFDENFNDMYGDTRIEVFIYLSEISQEIQNITEEFQFLVYGTKSNNEDFDEYDNNILSSLKYYEKNDSTERINYFILYYIIQVSHLFKCFLLDVSNIVCSLSLLNDNNFKDGQNRNVNEVLKKFLKKEFEDINNLLKFDMSKDKNIYINIQNIVSSIGLSIEELDYLVEAMGNSIDGPPSDKMIFSNMRHKAEIEINKKMNDLYKSFKFYSMCKTDYIDVLTKKMKIRGFLN